MNDLIKLECKRAIVELVAGRKLWSLSQPTLLSLTEKRVRSTYFWFSANLFHDALIELVNAGDVALDHLGGEGFVTPT